MNREQVRDWVAAYEGAWRAPGTGALAEIFTTDASYRQGPAEDGWKRALEWFKANGVA